VSSPRPSLHVVSTTSRRCPNLGLLEAAPVQSVTREVGACGDETRGKDRVPIVARTDSLREESYESIANCQPPSGPLEPCTIPNHSWLRPNEGRRNCDTGRSYRWSHCGRSLRKCSFANTSPDGTLPLDPAGGLSVPQKDDGGENCRHVPSIPSCAARQHNQQ